MPYTAQATKEELEESNRKCWDSECNKTAYFHCWTGDKNCFKHWKMDYKYGSCCGLWFALKNTKIINLKYLF